MKQFQYMLGPYSIKQLCYIESINEMLNKSLDFFLFVIYNKALIISKNLHIHYETLLLHKQQKWKKKVLCSFFIS